MMPCQSHDKVIDHWMLVLQFEQYIKKVGADVIEILGKSSVLVEMETHYRPPSFRWCRRLLINVKTATPLKQLSFLLCCFTLRFLSNLLSRYFTCLACPKLLSRNTLLLWLLLCINCVPMATILCHRDGALFRKKLFV